MSPSLSALNPQNDSTGSSTEATYVSKKKGDQLPPLFFYMEMGYWDKAIERATTNPREAKTWTTVRSKSVMENNSNGNNGNSSSNGKVSGAKRLALHHACFKLRSSNTTAVGKEDQFIAVCRFVLFLVKLYPEAAGMRESRHGCLPVHLAAFASCAPRGSEDPEDEQTIGSPVRSPVTKTLLSRATSAQQQQSKTSRPQTVSVRSESADTNVSGMTATYAEERYTGAQTQEFQQENSFSGADHSHSSCPAKLAPKQSLSISTNSSGMMSAKREEMAVAVVNALLDAYPKGVRVDSEGGRLPLHTACAGRATPRVVTTLLTAYSHAARHRNKDGFLPLHLCAHWGVSHPMVAVSLLKSYPDATVGRNRWERTPLEEALCMAGENGRPHQSFLVRALRKHPTYWTRPPKESFLPSSPPTAARRAFTSVVDVDEDYDDDDDTTNHSKDDIILMPSSSASPNNRNSIGRPAIVQRNKSSPGAIFGSSVRRISPKQNAKQYDTTLALTNDTLAKLIANKDWSLVMKRLHSHPNEASEELSVKTRGSFFAASGFYPLHYALERNPPKAVVEALISCHPNAILTKFTPGGNRPLHVACTWQASEAVVAALLSYDSSATKIVDELGNVPLHCACFSGLSVNAIHALVAANPKSVLARNRQGSLPADVCKRLRHDNRKSILTFLTRRKEELLAHRSSRSSGNLGAIALAAMTLNEREEQLPLKTGSRKKSHLTYLNDEDSLPSNTGIEVAIELEEDQEEMVWI